MIEIDGKYYVLDADDMKGAHKVKRQHDTKNVWRCRCPLCSDSRQKEHRMQKCLAVYQSARRGGAKTRVRRNPPGGS